MAGFLNRLLLAIALNALPLTLLPFPAEADSPGMEGSYVGVTLEGQALGDSARSLVRGTGSGGWLVDQVFGRHPQAERQFQGRVDLPDFPLSVRGTMVVGEDIRAVMPSLSYDVPLGNRANVFAGAGYAIVRDGEQTVVGDRDGLVLTAGAEAALNRSLVIYGDVRIRPDGAAQPENLRLQFGFGHRF